jgi:hypothetical protein
MEAFVRRLVSFNLLLCGGAAALFGGLFALHLWSWDVLPGSLTKCCVYGAGIGYLAGVAFGELLGVLLRRLGPIDLNAPPSPLVLPPAPVAMDGFLTGGVVGLIVSVGIDAGVAQTIFLASVGLMAGVLITELSWRMYERQRPRLIIAAAGALVAAVSLLLSLYLLKTLGEMSDWADWLFAVQFALPTSFAFVNHTRRLLAYRRANRGGS